MLELETLTKEQLAIAAEGEGKTPKDLIYEECARQTGLNLDRRQTLESLIDTAAAAVKKKAKGDKSGLARLEKAKSITHVKNPDTGHVFPATTLLLGQPHLIPWDVDNDCAQSLR